MIPRLCCHFRSEGDEVIEVLYLIGDIIGKAACPIGYKIILFEDDYLSVRFYPLKTAGGAHQIVFLLGSVTCLVSAPSVSNTAWPQGDIFSFSLPGR